jgi:hypothetical protein
MGCSGAVKDPVAAPMMVRVKTGAAIAEFGHESIVQSTFV